MAEPALKRLTFEEFADLNSEGRYELVNGQLEELVSPRPRHGWTVVQFPIRVSAQVLQIDPGGYWGGEVDIPTLPFYGRRPDYVYYSSCDRERISMRQNRVRGVPTLAVEIVSPDDRQRDLVTKRLEYAQSGIPHYWILDPETWAVWTLELHGDQYEVAGEFTRGEVLTSDLFPGLEVPVDRLFSDDD